MDSLDLDLMDSLDLDFLSTNIDLDMKLLIFASIISLKALILLKFLQIQNLKNTMFFKEQWPRCWIANPGVPCSKPLGGSKFDLAFHLYNAYKMSTRNFWKLSGKK